MYMKILNLLQGPPPDMYEATDQRVMDSDTLWLTMRGSRAPKNPDGELSSLQYVSSVYCATGPTQLHLQFVLREKDTR